MPRNSRRFSSCALDPPHLLAAARYVELNPVRAWLVAAPEAWPWSSARAHLAGRDDGLARVAPLLEAVGDWRAFLDGGLPEREADALRRHERIGRPLGGAGFVAELEARLGRRLRPGKRGRRKAWAAAAERVNEDSVPNFEGRSARLRRWPSGFAEQD